MWLQGGLRSLDLPAAVIVLSQMGRTNNCYLWFFVGCVITSEFIVYLLGFTLSWNRDCFATAKALGPESMLT
jgi:hypothetical protein